MTKRILVCAYFARNVGDDLFLKVLFDRYPGVKWDLLTANRHYLNVFQNYHNVKITYSYREFKVGSKNYNLFFKINELFSKYKKYDAIINIGGSIFMQNLGWEKKLNERQYLVSNFKKMNKKAFILGANFGPYKEEGFVEKHQALFSNYEDICFRDSYSYHLFKDLENVRVMPDVVFSLNTKKVDKKEKSVGFSTINLEAREGLRDYTQQYNEKIGKLIERYIQSGYQVKLFSFCKSEGDLKGIKDIKANVDTTYRNQIKVISYIGQLDAFLDEFKRCEMIIGTRFHSLVLAMLYNQSFYPLIYSEKTLHLLRDLGIENMGCHIRDIKSLEVDYVMTVAGFNKMKNKQTFSDANMQFKKLDEFIAKRRQMKNEKEAFICN